MESNARVAGSKGDSCAYGEDRHALFRVAHERQDALSAGREVGAVLPDDALWPASCALPEGPITTLPADVWRLFLTYLPMSETMSLRCTAQVAQNNVRVVTDAILSSCGLIDRLTQPGTLPSASYSEAMATLSTLRLEVRCGMLKRYAKQAGLRRLNDTGYVADLKAASLSTLTNRYFTKPSCASRSDHAPSVQMWQWTVASSKAALRDVTLDVSGSIALSDLFAAEIYAPLLGVVDDPKMHVERVMDEAFTTLSTLRWMDFLHAVIAVMGVSPRIAGAYETLVKHFDRTYPMPRIDVLAAIVFAMLMTERPKSLATPSLYRIDDASQNDLFATLVRASSIRCPISVREICLFRIGISQDCLEEHIMPRVTQSIAEWVVNDSALLAVDIHWRLRDIACSWSITDDRFTRLLHQSFLTMLAKRSYCKAAPWSTLSEPARMALRTQALGIPPGDSELVELDERTTYRFWGLYFEILNPNRARLYPGSESALDSLRWPLRAALWKIAAEVHADPRLALHGLVDGAYHALSARCIDTVCEQALAEDLPRFAIPALQATLMVQVARACRAVWDREHPADAVQNMGAPSIDAQCPVFSTAAWAILERCSRAERLPFIAALFGCRDVITQCGYEWTYEAMISNDIVAFLCDPNSSLSCPSTDVVDALLHHLPSCATLLPERLHASADWEAAFVKRFDLSSIETVPDPGQGHDGK